MTTMTTGRLWYADDPRQSILTKLAAAAANYARMYGAQPGIIVTNPNTAGVETLGDTVNVNGADVLIKLRPSVQPNNFWAAANPQTETTK